MQSGFVYAVINPSIPNLVKVGKTTRLPEDRALELSSATGVPTKFIVAYYDYFEDCQAAESYVHAMLDVEGHRVSDNREFFAAPLHVVVRMISSAPGKMAEDSAPDRLSAATEGGDKYDVKESDRSDVGDAAREVFLSQAEAAHYGRGEQLQDSTKALRLYKEAAKLGCSEAHFTIGNMVAIGDGTQEDKQKARWHWQLGVEQGDWRCYGQLAESYFESFELDNAKKCTSQYLKAVLSTTDNFDEPEKYWGIVTKVLTLMSHAALFKIQLVDLCADVRLSSTFLLTVNISQLTALTKALTLNRIGAVDDQTVEKIEKADAEFYSFLQKLSVPEDAQSGKG